MAQGLRVVGQTTGEGIGSLGGLLLLHDSNALAEIPFVSVCKCASLANHEQAPSDEPACHLAALTGKPEYPPGSQGRDTCVDKPSVLCVAIGTINSLNTAVAISLALDAS